MKSQQYYELSRKYEREAKQTPARFHRRLRRQLLLGYGYVIFILLLLTGVSIGSGIVMFLYPGLITVLWLVFSLFFTWDLLKTVLAKIPPVDGIRLEASGYPKLFSEMNELREQMDIPEIEEVILTTDFNAFAGEHRSRVIFGKKRRYVGIGLPLLEALSADEFRSVLAHEIAHLARGHSRWLAKIWHLRNVWLTILSKDDGSFWWRWFAKYYSDRFEAISAVVSREFEIEADRIAHATTDARNSIATSLKMELLGRTADTQQTQWINAQVLVDSKVPANVMSTYCQRLQQDLDPEESEKLMRRILAEETSIYLTHPACRDRIALAGFPVGRPLSEMVKTAMTYMRPLPEDRAEIASFYYLGSQRDALLKQANREYANESKEMWMHRTEYITNAKQQLQETELRINEAIESQKIPTESDLVARADIISEIYPRAAARAAQEDVLKHYPENASSLYITGYDAYQFDYDLVTAEDRFTRAIQADPRMEYNVSTFMVAICREMEKPEVAQRWHQHGFGAYDALQDSCDERASVTLKDKFIPATLTVEQLETIKSKIETLENRKNIKSVWVACKKVKLYPEKPLFVFGIEPNAPMLSFRTLEFYNAIGEEFANTINFDNQFFVVVIQGENKKFRKRFKKLKPPLSIDLDHSNTK